MWHLCFGLQAGLKENDSWLLSFFAYSEERGRGKADRVLGPEWQQRHLGSLRTWLLNRTATSAGFLCLWSWG